MITPHQSSVENSTADNGKILEAKQKPDIKLNQFQFMAMHLARVILCAGAILSALEGVARAMKGDFGRAVGMIIVVAPAMYGLSVALGVVANLANRDQD